MAQRKRKLKRSKSALPPEQKQAIKIKREHVRYARELFKCAGFQRITAAAGKEFTYQGITSDFDDLFVLENVIIVIEYTTSNESNVASHIKGKKILYDRIRANNAMFVQFIRDNMAKDAIPNIYNNDQCPVRIVYASRFLLRSETKNQVGDLCYLDYNYLRYFHNVAQTVKYSARFELLGFLDISPADFGEAVLDPGTGSGKEYAGSVLPEAHSHFPKGFKVISFYVDAATLLARAYVLRRDGWRSGSDVYQRMISKTKVEAIRKHLLDKNGVFVNNIIVTLPSSTKLLDEKGDTIQVDKINSTKPGKLRLTADYNSIGLVDGQHRVFSYHEGGTHDSQMEVLRKQQNLLVTGIMFPPNITEIEKTQFEARLFLEINSTQTNAKSDLKQAIGLLLKPLSPDSIARIVINQLNDSHGPLNNQFERYFYDKDKLKTTTIVSYGLRSLVRLSGDESFFSVWTHPDKSKLETESSDMLLADYIEFCVSNINAFVSAAKANIPGTRWTADRKVTNHILSTTFVNGLIFCLRKIVRDRKTGDFNYYRKRLVGLAEFDASAYKSSQYNAMAEALYKRFF